MSQETIEVTTPRGTMPVHIHRPDGDGPAPLVVLLMDAPGIRPALHAHAERLAAEGYTAVLPDLFYWIDPSQRPRPERLALGDQDEFKRMGAVVGMIDDDGVLADLALLLQAIPEASQPWGCVGFCMGGRFALRAAESCGEQLAATSMLHPSRIVVDGERSPHLAVGSVQGALYFGWGENDHVSPPELIPALRAQLDAGGVAYKLDLIPHADHGFTMPGMPAYDEAAAEQAWQGTLSLLDERLK